MCLGVPGKILEFFDTQGVRMARVEFGGIVLTSQFDIVGKARF